MNGTLVSGSSFQSSNEKAALIGSKNTDVLDADQEISNDQTEPGKKGSISITINDKTYYYDKGTQEEEELLYAAEIAKRESGQKQFAKQGICILLITCVILMNYLNPS